jgi:PIN domain nuclease of toxin-antitoxin system
MAIKRRTGKLRAPSNLLEVVTAAGLSLLAITAEHAEHAAGLEDLHHDPFDRILTAQATLERLTIVTADADIRRYEVSALDPAV